MFINPLRFKLDKPLVQSLFLFPRQFHCKTKGEKDEEMFTIKSCIFAAMLKGFWISSKHYKCITQDKLPPFFSIHTSPLRLAGELCQNTGTSSNFVRCSKWPVKNMKFKGNSLQLTSVLPHWPCYRWVNTARPQYEIFLLRPHSRLLITTY